MTLGGAAWTLTGCRDSGLAAPLSASLDVLAERYVRLALKLAKHQPSLVEAWLGPPAWSNGSRVPVPALSAEAATLLLDLEARAAGDQATGLPQARRIYLLGQVRALAAAARRLLGESQAFVDEARVTFGHVPSPRNAPAFDAIREQLSGLLPGPGTLADRHAAFRQAMAVPADRVEAVFAAAVDWCRTASRALLPLPAGENLTTRVADEAGWEAFSRPSGPRASDVWVARRGSADAAHLLQLAAHEATPGHHAQHVLATAELVDALGWQERALAPAFGPHRLVAEGSAEAGADLLLPLETRERVCRDLLMPAALQRPAAAARLVRIERLVAGLGMEVAHTAHAYLDSSLPSADVAARLRDDALVLDPAGMVVFIEKQRAKVLAYPLGRQLVAQAVDAAPAADRWGRFRSISTTLTLEA